MGSNAYTCCDSNTFSVLSMTQSTDDLYPYDSKNSHPLYNIPVLSAVTAYDKPSSQQTYILVFNELLYYSTKLDHTPVNPNHFLYNRTQVWDNPFDENHQLPIECNNDVMITLQMRVKKTFFQSCSPKSKSLNTFLHIELIS